MDDGLRTGIRVLVRGERCTVVGITPFHGCAAVRLAGSDGPGRARTLLVPFDRFRLMASATGGQTVRPRSWLRAVRRIGAAAHPFGGLKSAAASRIDILPYQLEPALAVAGGATRVMIADAVGLGKTVQAGLILNELAGQAGAGGSFRALVAAPAGLREQWARELATHFELPAIVTGAAWLARTGHELPADVNPWILPEIYIASFDFLKRPEVLRPLEEVAWDVLIVDEAHNAGLGTARRAAIHDIARRSRRVILLTATPHAGDTSRFEALCRIGLVDGDRPLVIFRRTRHDAGVARPCRSVLLPVRLSPAERRMHRLLDDYAGRVCREAGLRGDSRARLAAIVLRKRALSSAASLAASVSKRLNLLAGVAAAPERQLLLPLADEDSLPDGEPELELAAPGLTDAAEERRLLRRIADAARSAADNESKTRVLVRLLARAGEPAIVFTEYRDTLVRLHAALAAAGLEAATMHGGQSPAERAAIQREVNDRGVILLATDAAAEGLNLQARCRMVVHYELPWSPARIEQRTGRVDRIGQRRTVHEILLVARDTAERLVLAPLARRAARARSALPGASHVLALLTESHVAAAVMDGVPMSDALGSQGPRLDAVHNTDGRAEAEAARLRTVREWSQAGACAPSPGSQPRPLVTMVRRRTGVGGAICLYQVSLASAGGRVEHSELVAVRDAESGRPLSWTAAASRRALDDWLTARDAHVRRLVGRVTEPRIAAAAARYTTAVAALARREEAMAHQRPSVAMQLVQAGLFDNRVVRAHRARQGVAGALLEESAARLESLDPASKLATTVELVAVIWLGPRQAGGGAPRASADRAPATDASTGTASRPSGPIDEHHTTGPGE